MSKIYYIDRNDGYCGLTTAPKRALRELGTANVRSIRLATAAQIESVRAMGGHVPQIGKGKNAKAS